MEKKIPVTTDVKNLRHFNIYNKSTVQFEPTFVSTGRQIEAIANTKPNEIAIIEINKEKVKVLSRHPEESYELVMNDKKVCSAIKIINPNDFWKYTDYLVITTK